MGASRPPSDPGPRLRISASKRKVSMDVASLNYNWFDLLAILLVLIGVARGRKRGLSQEVIDMFKWLLIVVIAAYVYEPWGTLLAEKTVFSLLYSFIAVYVATRSEERRVGKECRSRW